MPLSDADMEKIKGLGFDYDFFVANVDNWLQLKNKDERCVFNDGKKCLIYESRPEGCKLYPITYDEGENCAVLDEYCPHKNSFKISKSKIKIVSSLVARLKKERMRRMQ